MGKTVRKSFNGRNLQQMTRVTKGLCLYKNSDPKGLSAPAYVSVVRVGGVAPVFGCFLGYLNQKMTFFMNYLYK